MSGFVTTGWFILLVRTCMIIVPHSYINCSECNNKLFCIISYSCAYTLKNSMYD
jgi:hypothetical protein